MPRTFNRFSVFFALLGIASGATALAAAIDLSPSTVTVETRMSERVTAKTEGADLIKVAHENCTTNEIASLSNFKSTVESSSGTGQPSKKTHTVSFTVQAKRKVGQCTVTLSAGSSTATLHVRVEERR